MNTGPVIFPYMVNLGREYYTRNHEILRWLSTNFPEESNLGRYRVFQAFGHLWIEFEKEEDRTFFQLNWL